MCGDKPRSWARWIPIAEWWYNTSFHSAIKSTPFEVVYGQAPPIHLPYIPGSSASVTVDRTLSAQEEVLQLLKFHLKRVQKLMVQQANSHRSERSFSIGDFVYLKLHPYQQQSLKPHHVHKLLPKFYGPFKVLDCIGKAAYQLELPPEAKIHNVFHVSQLKLCSNPSNATVFNLPPTNTVIPDSTLYPEAIIDRKMVKRGSIAATKVLVKWKDLPASQATWEFYLDFLKKYPHFNP